MLWHPLCPSNKEPQTSAFLLLAPVFSIVQSILEHYVVKLCQLYFHLFWNFMNVIISNYNDIEPGFLSNSSL